MYHDLMHLLLLFGLQASMYSYALCSLIMHPISHPCYCTAYLLNYTLDCTVVQMYYCTQECNNMFYPIICSSGGGCKVVAQLSHLTLNLLHFAPTIRHQ